jgi:2,4-dienoyl-CoA reductase-like NADH-dependent reductase (Old Yellow Enzyme family)
MSVLFTPLKVGGLEIKNRFVHAGTYEVMADEKGFVTDQLINRYKNLARGEVGLIIPGYSMWYNIECTGTAFLIATCYDSHSSLRNSNVNIIFLCLMV